MKIEKALITGATGFMGGRIAERLWIDCGIRSHCLIRNYSNAARLARLPVTMIRGDILDRSSIERAIEGCRIVFHCAYGNTGDNRLNSRINEEGTRNIGEIALRKGIERFVYISSIAVHGSAPPKSVDEDSETQFSDSEYGNSKIRSEKICRDLLDKGLPVVIIRPTIVFGPFSPIWTVGAIKRIILGGWDNVEGMDGLCNAVYIDDLVDSLFLCARVDGAVGETFTISGEAPVTWNDYYRAYMRLAGIPAPRKTSIGISRTKALARAFMRANLNVGRNLFESQMIEIYQFMRETFPLLTRRIDKWIRGGIRNNEMKRFSQKTIYSIEKAKTILGYEPRPFKEGMRLTGEWLRHHHYI